MANPNRRGTAVLGAALALGLIAAACGEKQDPSAGPEDQDNALFQEDDSLEAQPGGSIKYGLGGETDGWNPTINRWAGQGQQVAFAIYDHVAELDENGDPQPFLAESIEHNDAYDEWTIVLRDGVTFHDGSTLTANDLKLNLEAYMRSPLTGKALTPILDEGGLVVDPADDLTLTIKTEVPWVAFPVFMAGQTGVVASPASLGIDPDTGEVDGSKVTANTDPVGTGPFTFDDWEIDRQLVVKKNPEYWRDGLPYLDEITFTQIIDAGNRVNSLVSGDVSVVQMSVSASGIQDLRDIACTEDPCEEGTVKLYDNQKTAEGEEGMLMVQTLRPPFDDPVARQAVAHSINRDDLLTTVFDNVFEVANGPWTPDSEWYNPDVEDMIPEFDPDLGRELAEEYEATHGEPISFEFSIPVGLPEVENSAQVVAEQLSAVGIDVEVRSYEMTKYVEKLIAGDYQGIAFQWFGNADPDAEYQWWHSSSIPTGADGELLPTGGISLNFARLSDPEVDAALDAARSETDPAKRKEQYDIVQEQFAEDLSFMWLFHGFSLVAWRPEVRDVVNWELPDGAKGQPLNSTGAHPVAQIWVEK